MYSSCIFSYLVNPNKCYSKFLISKYAFFFWGGGGGGEDNKDKKKSITKGNLTINQAREWKEPPKARWQEISE
jgi:hypothetical protein